MESGIPTEQTENIRETKEEFKPGHEGITTHPTEEFERQKKVVEERGKPQQSGS
jgi:hypothetical protein